MRILITGAAGQLGRCLLDTADSAVEVTATDVGDLDLCDPSQVGKRLHDIRPDCIINAAAHTAVDAAEAAADAARAINAEAVATLARYCLTSECRLIQISTDFVFAGDQSRPYKPGDRTQPLGVYGQTKLEGEQAATLAGERATVIRTSWLYSEHGNNFVKTMLGLARSRSELAVVDDQTGSPTYARNLAGGIWRLTEQWPASRLLHYADEGAVTRIDFARTIMAEAQQLGIISRQPEISPVSTAEFSAPAPRPKYSVLDPGLMCEQLGIAAPPWRQALRDMLGRLELP